MNPKAFTKNEKNLYFPLANLKKMGYSLTA